MYDYTDYHNMRGVSLFDIGNGMRNNFYKLPDEDYGEVVEHLAEIYYHPYHREVKKLFKHYSKLNGEQRKRYRLEKQERSRGW